jgi:hypothetical protein
MANPLISSRGSSALQQALQTNELCQTSINIRADEEIKTPKIGADLGI